MLWNRGGQGDYDNWVQLGNPGWSWDDMLPYFIRSETYTPVASQQVAMQFSIEDDMSVHGLNGPVNVSFPDFMWNSSAVLFEALNELGIPTSYDPNTGQIAGASFLPLDIDPIDQSRSTARRAYYDPISNRPNLWVSTGQVATQLLFANTPANVHATVSTADDSSVGQGTSPGMPGGIYGGTTTLNATTASSPNGTLYGRSAFWKLYDFLKSTLRPRQSLSGSLAEASAGGLVAVGVESASSAQSARQNVTATREVIIAAGAIHSPQLLMLSGIGPSTTLDSLSIPVNVDLPGVGSNLQDHGQVWCWYPYYNSSYSNPTELDHNQTFANDAWAEYEANRTGPLTSSAIDGVAFPALPFIVNGSTAIAQAASAQSAQQYLAAGLDSTVVAGFAEQLPMLIEALQDATRASYELINGNDGVLNVATMRPFSRGLVTLSSSDPFDPPVIDPRYGSNPIDYQVSLAAMAFNQRLLVTQSLSQMDPVQRYPPADATDAELQLYIGSKLQTEYHPAGTNAMMPIHLGGVVSADLLVYGTANVRVVDASIIPMIPAAHLQAVVYGIAEKVSIPKLFFCVVLTGLNRPPTSSRRQMQTTPQPALPRSHPAYQFHQ